MNIELFLAIVNGVTSYHRHGNPIPKAALDKLSNAQIEMEKLKSHNKDYSAALEIMREYVNCNGVQDNIIDVIKWMKERLNSQK